MTFISSLMKIILKISFKFMLVFHKKLDFRLSTLFEVNKLLPKHMYQIINWFQIKIKEAVSLKTRTNDYLR